MGLTFEELSNGAKVGSGLLGEFGEFADLLSSPGGVGRMESERHFGFERDGGEAGAEYVVEIA